MSVTAPVTSAAAGSVGGTTVTAGAAARVASRPVLRLARGVTPDVAALTPFMRRQGL